MKLLPKTRSPEVDYSVLIVVAMTNTLERPGYNQDDSGSDFPPIFIDGRVSFCYFNIVSAPYVNSQEPILIYMFLG